MENVELLPPAPPGAVDLAPPPAAIPPPPPPVPGESPDMSAAPPDLGITPDMQAAAAAPGVTPDMQGVTSVGCYNCGGQVPITSDVRPLSITCPSCGAQGEI